MKAAQWNKTVDLLLRKHFVITINDTALALGDDELPTCHPFEAVNAHAEDCVLDRVDTPWNQYQPLTIREQFIVLN